MSLLGEVYRVEGELARGGMGRVLRVTDTRLDRQLAVKTVLYDDDALKLRFVREAQISGLLNHPLIVPVHELGRDADEVYLVMKLVEGRELKELIADLRTEPEVRAEYGVRRLARLFLKVCEGIAFAHAHQVVHRDIKPANIMLGPDDAVHVMDWGIARHLLSREDEALAASADGVGDDLRDAQLTRPGGMVGTPAYMAPEQADGGPPSPLLDVYALGALLYELLTHRPPYEGGSQAVTAQLALGPPPRPRDRAPENEIPPALESIALKAMAREPAERYPNASALAADVEAFLDGRAAVAHVEGPLEALARLLRRHRLAAASAALGLLALALGGGAAAWVTHRQEQLAQADVALAEGLEQEARKERAEAQAASAAALRVARQAADRARVRNEVDAFMGLASTPERLEVLFTERDRLQTVLDELRQRPAPPRPAPDEDDENEHEHEEDETTARSLEAAPLSERVDLILAGALVRRAPQQALERLDGLQVGAARPVLEARALLRLGREDEALALLKAADPPSDREDLRRGAQALRLHLEHASFAEQEEALTRVLERDALSAWAHWRRAELRCLQGRFAEGRADYERAGQLEPVDPWLYASRFEHAAPIYAPGEFRANMLVVPELAGQEPGVLLGWAWLNQHLWWRSIGPSYSEYEVRIERLQREGKLTPLATRRFLALARLVEGEPAQALVHAREAVRLRPRDRRSQGLLAEALARSAARGLSAAEEAGGAGEQAKVDAAALDLRAVDLLDEAEQIARAGLAIHDADPRLNGALGLVLVLRERFAAAAPHLTIAARGSLEPDPWRRLAECLLEVGTPEALEQGVQAGREALARDPFNAYSFAAHDVQPIPGDPRIHRVLCELRARQGQLAAASLHAARAALHAGFQHPMRVAGRRDRSDALRAAELHEQLGLTEEAAEFYRWAAQDTELKARAQRALERLGSN